MNKKWNMIILILILLMPAGRSFAQQAAVSATVKEYLSIDNCHTNAFGSFCHYYMDFHLEWNRSTAFPIDNPSSSTGYWLAHVWENHIGATGPTIISGTSVDGYSGSHFLLSSEGTISVSSLASTIASIRAGIINAKYHAFAYFIKPAGNQVTFSSGAAVISNDVGEVAMEDDPLYNDLQPRPSNNPKCQGDPVYLHSGQFYYQCNDLQIPGRKLNVDLSHTYFSGLSFNGPFGYGWMINYYMRLHEIQDGDAVIVSGDGRKIRYNLSGSVYVPPVGHFENLVKNGDDSWTLTMAQGEQYHFNDDGLLVTIEDRNNNDITLSYSSTKEDHEGRNQFAQDLETDIVLGSDYRLESIVDTTGREIEFNYNGDGLLSSIVDDSRTVSLSYDGTTNDLLTVTKPATAEFPSGVTKTFTYENHNVKTVEDAKEQVFVENFYDSEGRVETQTEGEDDWEFDYSTPNEVTETDRKGNETRYVFNAAGNMTLKEEFTNGLRVGEPASFVTTYTYNSDSLKTSETFPAGNGIKYVYDSSNVDYRARGNLLEVRRKTSMAASDNNTNDIVTAMTYEDNFNQLKTLTDAKGEVTEFTYDYELDGGDPDYGTVGDLVMIEAPEVTGLGVATTYFSYNNDGQMTKKTDPNGNETDYTYETTTGYLESVTADPGGINAQTQYEYDANGYVDIVTNAEGNTVDFNYNELGWLIAETNALGYLTKYTHDENGNLTKIEKQANSGATVWQTTEFTYDLLNNLKTVKDPLNRITTYNYDENENKSSVVDAESNTTTYAYDERDLLFTVTDAMSPAGVTTYDYDVNGNLAKIIDAEGNETEYVYDLFDRLDTTTYADSSVSDFNYDKNSNLIKHTTPSAAVIDYDYDELNRLTDKIFPATTSLNATYEYDLGGRLTDADTAVAQIHYDYDNLDRVDDVTYTLNSNNFTLDYDYYKNGLRKQLVYPSSKTVDYTYDADDQPNLIKVDTTNFADYDFDVLGRKTQRAFLDTASTQKAIYAFDIANQLESVINRIGASTPISKYEYTDYDEVGNRKEFKRTYGVGSPVTTNYTYSDAYELTGVSGGQSHSYDYDKVGNREVADSVTYVPNNLNQYDEVDSETFIYNDNGNLTSDGNNTYTYDAENRLATVGNTSHNASYGYDALNRRVKKTLDSVTTYFVHDDDSIVADYTNAGGLITEYVYGHNIDELLASDNSTTRYYYHADGLGSITEVTNNAGTILENYTYDPFGTPSVTTSSIGNRYRFTGREYDEESGIYYYRARQYDPAMGRFLQRDPIGYNGGINLYTYANNNSINLVDPDGKLPVLALVLIGAGGGAAFDFLTQVGVNLVKGDEAFSNIDKRSVIINAGVNAVLAPLGLTAVTQAIKAGKLAKTSVELTASLNKVIRPDVYILRSATISKMNQAAILTGFAPLTSLTLKELDKLLSKDELNDNVCEDN